MRRRNVHRITDECIGLTVNVDFVTIYGNVILYQSRPTRKDYPETLQARPIDCRKEAGQSLKQAPKRQP